MAGLVLSSIIGWLVCSAVFSVGYSCAGLCSVVLLGCWCSAGLCSAVLSDG